MLKKIYSRKSANLSLIPSSIMYSPSPKGRGGGGIFINLVYFDFASSDLSSGLYVE